MKNEHLVPVNVIDLVDKLNDTTIKENERNNYVFRLEAIRDYTTACLNTYSRDKNSFSNNRKKISR
jgi:hypothetical protein